MKKQLMNYHNRRFYIVFISIVLLPIIATAQNECALKLKEAEQLYDEGRIEKIPAMLNPCLKKGFNKEERISALRLLTLVYLYEDRLESADEAMLNLLKAAPEYTINQSIDPAEFISLYKTFNTNPVYSIGLAGGINYTFPFWIEKYGVHNVNNSTPAYSPSGVGITGTPRITYHYTPDLDFLFEPGVFQYTYEYNEQIYPYANVNSIVSGINLNFLLSTQYSFYKWKKFSVLAEGGITYGLTLDENAPFILSYTNDAWADVTGQDINTLPLKRKNRFYTTLGLELKYKLPQAHIFLNIRSNIGLYNVSNPNERNTIDELQNKYHYIENDLLLHHLNISIGYSRAFFLHRKK